MRESSVISQFSVGFVLFLATMVVVGALFWVGSDQGLFSRRYSYEVLVPSTNGLMKGAPVKLSGVPVGVVRDIEFADDLSASTVKLTLAIESDVAPRIREDSVAWLQTEGLLGDYSVHISLGTIDKDALPPYSQIPFKSRPPFADLVGVELTQQTAVLMNQMVSILRDLQEGQGVLGRLLNDPELYKTLSGIISSVEQFGRELQDISVGVNEMVNKVKSERGLLGKVLFSSDYEQKIARSLDDASSLIEALNGMAETVRRGEGSLGKALADDRLYRESLAAVEELASAARSVTGVLENAQAERSILGRVLVDDELGQEFASLVERLNRSASSLESVLGMLESGEGTASQLLRDPSLYASLRNVVIGVQESGYVINFIRNMEERGREAILRRQQMTAARLQEIGKAGNIVSGTAGEDAETRPASGKENSFE